MFFFKFWNYRLLFAQDVKNYEELLPWYGGEEVQWVKRITGSIDGYLERIFLFLWPRTDYWLVCFSHLLNYYVKHIIPISHLEK
jgi:hypothetical protein